MITISTPRLLLRPLRASDLDVLDRLYGDPEVMEHIGGGGTATREETADSLLRLLEADADAGPGLLAADLRASGEMVGRCGFKEWTIDGVTELEIGWMFLPEVQGQGLATEAGRALRDYAFETLDRDRVISIIEPSNAASIRVANKIGERFWRNWATPGGLDVVVYRMDRAALPAAEA